jgi:hypothetical protein
LGLLRNSGGAAPAELRYVSIGQDVKWPDHVRKARETSCVDAQRAVVLGIRDAQPLSRAAGYHNPNREAP